MAIFQKVPKMALQASSASPAAAAGAAIRAQGAAQAQKRTRPDESQRAMRSLGEEQAKRSLPPEVRRERDKYGPRGDRAEEHGDEEQDLSALLPLSAQQRCEDGLFDPAPTVLLTMDDKMVLNSQALALLQSGRPHVPLVIVSIVGKARRGKSFLMNRAMLGKAQQMFQVSSSSNACTKGIIIHGRPWPLRPLARRCGLAEEEVCRLADADVVFADTEGIDATDRTDGYDNNMLTFACVASGAIIYNAHGPIDEDALSKISTIAEVGRSILDENHHGGGGGGGAGPAPLHPSALPSFHWCARDFALDCHDAGGNEITPDEYLECQLSEQGELHPKKSAMRRALRAFFQTRMCHTLPRPVASEDDLKRVQDMDDRELRPQFVDAMKRFRARLFQTLRGKQVGQDGGSLLTGSDMVCMMQKFVRAINDGAVPNVQDSWQQVAESRARRAHDAALAQFQQRASAAGSGQQQRDALCVLYHALKVAAGECVEAFDSKVAGLVPQAVDEFRSSLLHRMRQSAADVRIAWQERQGGAASKLAESARSIVAHLQQDGGSCVFDAAAADVEAVAGAGAGAASPSASASASASASTSTSTSAAPGVERKLREMLEALVAVRRQGRGQACGGVGGVGGVGVGVGVGGGSLDEELGGLVQDSARCEEADAVMRALPKILGDQFATYVQAGGGGSCVAEFEQMEQRYEAEMEAMSTRAMHLEQENAAVHSIKSEAERAASELNEKLQCLQRTCESLREQLEFANSGEARAAELDKELREQREQEEVRAAEQQRRMDEFERSMHLQLEDMTHDMLEQREGLVEAERELKRCKREGDELERELLAERKGSESRDRAIDAERAIIKEELQSTRAMLNDAHSKLLARMDNKHAATVQAAEDRLKFTQLLRTTETALAKAQAEKVAAEREVAELRDKVKAFGAVRSELEECRLATSKHQSENEWLKNDRRSLQEQLRETAKELMIARQDLRECRMSNALASTRNQTFGRTAVQ